MSARIGKKGDPALSLYFSLSPFAIHPGDRERRERILYIILRKGVQREIDFVQKKRKENNKSPNLVSRVYVCNGDARRRRNT